MRHAARRHHASRPTIWEVHSCGRLEGRFESKDEAQDYVKSRGKPGVKLTLRQIEIEEPVMQHATKKKSPAQLQREIDEVLASSPAKPPVKCPSSEHPLYPELRHIRQVAHDTSWTASQLAKDAEEAFRSGDCEKAATMLEAAKRVIAKERRKRPSARSTKRHHATSKAHHPGKYMPGGVEGGETRYVVTVPPTREMGSYKTRVRGPMSDARRDALWDYNSARRHDDLPPVDRMPSGTKYTKER